MRTIAPVRADAFSLRRWVGWVTAGEGIGFLIPLTGLAAVTLAGAAPILGWAIVTLCGAGEGAMLGFAQSHALRGTRAEVPRRQWIGVTATAATLAWSLGMLPSTLVDLDVHIDMAHPVTWLVVGAGGVVLLASIPTAQYLVLTRVVPWAWRWIPLNMCAWLIGLMFTFLPTPFVDEGTSAVVLTMSFAVAGVCMAATVATIVGLGLSRLTSTSAGVPAHYFGNA